MNSASHSRTVLGRVILSVYMITWNYRRKTAYIRDTYIKPFSAFLNDQISWFTKPKSKWQSFNFIQANRPETDVSLFERSEKTWLLQIKSQFKVRTGVWELPACSNLEKTVKTSQIIKKSRNKLNFWGYITLLISSYRYFFWYLRLSGCLL